MILSYNGDPHLFAVLAIEDWSRTGIHNIRPAGQMWPALAFNLAPNATNFCLFCMFL